MKHTEKLGLKKPEVNDYININDINDNMDILDEEISNLKEGTTIIEELQTEDKTLAGAINEIYTKFNEHKLENIKHRRIFIGDEPVDPEINDIWLDPNPQRIILADWRMNETVGNIIQDYSGNGYHAVAEGGIAITDPINPLSAKSRTGDGTTGVIRTQFNATAGLNNFKVEAFVKLNSIQTGFVSIVNNYRNASNYAAGWHLSHHDEYGVAARVVATEKSTIGPGGELYSGFILEPEKVYKLELEFDGLIATLRIYEFVGNKLILLYSGSEEAIGTLQTDMLPLTMLANNSEPTGEFSTFTIGRVRITTLMV